MPKGIPAKGTKLCSARKSNGDPCKKLPINGTTVCRFHGGAAPQVKRKAKQRLEEAADRMARELLRMAESSASEAVKLAAIKDALDRAGLNPKQAHEVALSVQPWEAVLQGVVAGERRSPAPDETLRSRPTTTAANDPDIIDAEWHESEVDEPPSCRACGRQFPPELPPGLDAYPEICRDCREPASAEPRESPTPAAPLVTWEEGVTSAAKANRSAGVVPINDRRKRRNRPDGRGGRGEFAG